MTENRARKMRNESKVLDKGNRDMEQRLREIKELFEKEQVKREKEALIWSSAGDGKKRKQQLDQQSRKILGKGFQTSPQKPKFKVLKDEPLNLPERKSNQDLNKFISNQRNRIDDSKNRKTKSKSAKAHLRVPSVSPPVPQPPAVEEYALLSDVDGSEIFELPLTPQGHLNLQVVRAVSSSRTIGIYAFREGRKRLLLADESGSIPRPSGGWNKTTFYPLVPPRSSRPSTAGGGRDHDVPVYRAPTPPSGGALLRGEYDEAQNAKAFKLAVQQFRGANKQQQQNEQQTTVSEVTITDEVETEMEDKLEKIGAMFEVRNNLSVMERILLEKSKSAENGDFSENFDEEKTEEELEIEEERKHFREMLIGRTPSAENVEKTENLEKAENVEKAAPVKKPEENWTVPAEWSQNEIIRNNNIIQNHQLVPTNADSSLSLAVNPMWIPTPHIEAETEMIEEIRNEPSSTVDSQGPLYEPAGEVYQEHIRTVYDDGTIVSNIITVETPGGDDSESDGEWVQCSHPSQEWSGYDSDENIDLGTDSEFKREAMRIIDEHARRYHEQHGEPAARPDSALNRPASRASVVTDADLETDFDLTEKLTQMDQKYYPSDEYE